jgi:hypothetical protein
LAFSLSPRCARAVPVNEDFPRAAQAAGVQDEKATGDAALTAVAVALFWPAAFALSGDGRSAAELGRLRGEKDAIEQASIRKGCGIQFSSAPAPSERQNAAPSAHSTAAPRRNSSPDGQKYRL